MRVSVDCGRHRCTQRVQLGLMTSQMDLAFARARAVWSALKLAGFMQEWNAVCHHIEHEGNVHTRQLWKREELECDNVLEQTSVNKYRLLSCNKHEIDMERNQNGEYEVMVTRLSHSDETATNCSIPLYTRDKKEALSRACIIFRTLRIAARQHEESCEFIHGTMPDEL